MAVFVTAAPRVMGTPNLNGFGHECMWKAWTQPIYQISTRILAIKGRREHGSQLKKDFINDGIYKNGRCLQAEDKKPEVI